MFPLLRVPRSLQGYGDHTTPMGFCHRCIYNSIDQLRLGWSRSLAVIDWSSFSGTSEVTLPAMSAVASVRDLQAVVIRLQNPRNVGVPSGLMQEIYLSYKVAANQDQGLPAMYSATTHVHAVDASTGDSWILAWLSTPRICYINLANRMAISQLRNSPRSAVVSICKYVGSSSECGECASPFVATNSLGAASESTFDTNAYYHGHYWSHSNRTVPASAGSSHGEVSNNTFVTEKVSSSVEVAAELEAGAQSTGVAATNMTEEASILNDKALP